MKKALALLLVAALMPLTAVAQPSEYGKVTTLDGSAINIARPNAAPVELKFKDPVFLGNRIETKAESLVKMLLGGKALVTVREQSSLTITETEGKATINLANGKVAVFTKNLRPGDSIEIRTPNAIASVRGSLGIVEHIPVGTISHVDNADGTVLGGLIGGALVLIPALQGLTIVGGAIGALRGMRPDAKVGLHSKSKPGQGQKTTASKDELDNDLSETTGAVLGSDSAVKLPPYTPRRSPYKP